MRKLVTALVLAASASLAMAADALQTFVVEYKTGAAWDTAKPPQEQKHFADHSAYLKRMRDEGKILLGARYADKGVLVMQAASIEELRKLVQADVAVSSGLFTAEVHPINVFYGGCVPARNKPC